MRTSERRVQEGPGAGAGVLAERGTVQSGRQERPACEQITRAGWSTWSASADKVRVHEPGMTASFAPSSPNIQAHAYTHCGCCGCCAAGVAPAPLLLVAMCC